MLIDFLGLMILAVAAFKGYREGLIVGIFSYLALLIGLAVAMKCSTLVAARIKSVVGLSDNWAPLLSFLIVFVAVVILIQWFARLLHKLTNTLRLGWLNRIGGMALFILNVFLSFRDFSFLPEANAYVEQRSSSSLWGIRPHHTSCATCH